jgi:hypothetical protein
MISITYYFLIFPFYFQLIAQLETWASHVSVRNFWGVTEEQDYDVHCADETSEDALQTFVQNCRLSNPAFGDIRRPLRGWGWFCAQRRPGHALGWLQKMYKHATMIPDIFILVDDDTAVDIEEVQRQMLLVQDYQYPYVGNPCMGNFGAGTGGAGTFFNRAAIETLSRPIFCDDQQQESMNSVCENIQANRADGKDIFQQGDSAFDIFYKFSALRDFCVHSDQAMAQMINVYSGGKLHQMGQCHGRGPGGRRQPCYRDSISCHYQTPESMKEFVLARTCPQSPFLGWPASSDC